MTKLFVGQPRLDPTSHLAYHLVQPENAVLQPVRTFQVAGVVVVVGSILIDFYISPTWFHSIFAEADV